MTEHHDRGYAKLARAATNVGGLTETGKVFLVQALDPYHDFEVPTRGIPDMYNGKSVCLVIEKSMQVSKTLATGLPATDTSNWDVRFDLLPFLKEINVTAGALNFDSNSIDATWGGTSPNYQTNVIWPLTITGLMGNRTVFPDNTINPLASAAAMDNYYGLANYNDGASPPNIRRITGMSPGDQFTHYQAVRVVSAGFEVDNTTADLYKQGMVTVYRSPDWVGPENKAQQYGIGWDGGGGTINRLQAVMLEQMSLPPPKLQDIMLLPKREQWRAEHGTYNPAVLNPVRLPNFVSLSSNLANCMFNDDGPDYAGGNTKPVWAPQSIYTQTVSPYQVTKCLPCAIMPTGAYYQGLSYQTTFNLNVRWVLEVVPMYNNQLIVQANVSAPYDMKALELYYLTSGVMPPACTREENPLGEWFDKVMGILSSASTAIGSIFGPVGAGIGAAGASLFGAAAAYNASLRK